MSRRLMLLALVLLGVLGCAAVAVAQYPDCGFNCTAGDVTVEGARIEVPEGACVLGEDVTANIYATFSNGTKSTRYAVRVLGDLYVNGTTIASLDACVAESIPPGDHEYLLMTESIPCSARVEFRFVIVSWAASAESCGDEPKCSDRKAKCWQPSGGTLVIQVPALVIGFTSNAPACLGGPVRFTSTTTGGRMPYQYQWELGDGTTSTEANPSHTYAAAGDYMVSLTVRDAAGATGTALQDVVVLESPFATADNGGPYCQGQTIELYADGGVSYKWMGPSGFASAQQNPTIPGAGAANAGTYTVTVSDAYGCSSQAVTLVFLDATPPTLSVPPDATFECGEAYDPSIAAEASAVDDEDPAPSVTYSDLRVVGDCGGAERILRTWIATDACGNRAMATQTITLVDTTPPALSISDATVECDGAGNQDDIAAWLASAVATDGCGTAAVENDFTGVSDRCPGTGTARVTFTASDACGNVTEAQATLSIVDSTAPDAADDQATTYEDHAILVQVLANDSDLCPGELTIVEVSQAGLGAASVVGQAIEYVPSDDMNGEVEFQYTIEDCAGHRDTALVRITVTSVNDAPTATDRTETLSEDESLGLQLEGADVDGDELTFAVADGPAHGALVGFDPTTGAVTYVPNPDYNGVDSFTFTVCDPSGACAMGTVTLVVEAVNDAPTAVDQTETVSEDGSISGQFAGTDPDGDALTFAIVTWPEHGTVTIVDPETATGTYVPNPNYHGTDTFTFTACDPSGACDTGTITLVVTPLNDAPEAVDQAETVDEDGSLGLRLEGTDVDGDELTFAVADGPTHGTLVGFDATTGAVMYVPNPNYHGQDSFTFTVCDPSGACDTGTIAVTVSPVNDAPVAEEQDVWTREDVELPIRLSGSDVDGEAVSYAISITPQHGTLVGFDAATGAVTYIPGPDFAGMDSFVFTVCDGQLACAQATITIEVAAVNDPPNVPDVLWTTNEDTPTGFLALEIVDPDQSLDELVYSVLELPLHGTLEWGPSGTAQYTPDPDFFGTDSVSYQVCDAAGACDGARITVLVLAQNDAPSANGASLTVSATDPNPITLTASDPDGDVLVYRLLSQPDHGSILDFDDATGVLTYVAAAAYEGGDAFSFEVCDASGACDTAIVELRVVATAHAPVAEPQAVSTFEDTPLEIVLRATDVDGDSLTYSILGAPAHGRIEALDATTGALVYVPGRGFDGEDVFTFEACDSTGACAVSFVTVSVLPVNNPPSVVSLETTVTAGVAVEIALVARDPDEDPVTFTILQPPTHGSVVRFDPESGVLVYLPDEGYAGPDVVAFAACDPWGACADGVVQTFAVLTTGGGGAVGGCDRRVVISEVAWAGTAAGAADEWIELRNLEDAEVDLTGWTMRWRPLAPASALDGFWRAIGLTGIVGAFSGTSAATVTPVGGGWHRVDVHAEPTADIALLERGADNVVADVRAIQVYVDTVALGRRLDLPDGGAVMELVDPYGCLVDRVDPSAELRQGWPAGNAEPSASMQRSEALAETPDAGWSTNWGPFTSGDDRAGHPILGTPGRVNPPAIGDILALLPVEGAREIPMGATLIVVLPDEPGAWTSGSTIVRLTDRQTGTLAIPVSELLAEVRSVGGVTTLVVGTMDLPSGEYALWVRGAFNAVYATLVAIKP